jgi:hypothetical protein
VKDIKPRPATSRQRRRRLTLIRAALLREEGLRRDQRVPSGLKLNMAVWARHAEGTHRPSDHNYCGSAACLLGTAGLIPVFRRSGLITEFDGDIGTVSYGPECQSNAGKLFFGLANNEVHVFHAVNARGGVKRLRTVIRDLDRLIANTPPDGAPSPARLEWPS